MRALQCTLEWDIKARDELRYSCTHTRNQSERSWIKAALLFLAERNKNRITLEATDDLGTLIVDPLQLARINYYLRGLAAWVGLGSPACNPSIFWAVEDTELLHDPRRRALGQNPPHIREASRNWSSIS